MPYGSAAVRPYGGPQRNVTVSLLAMLEEAVCVLATAFVGTMVGTGESGVCVGLYGHHSGHRGVRYTLWGGVWAPWWVAGYWLRK